jgi:peptidoglycan-associated lipoprotein
MRFKFLTLFAAVLLLGACETTPEETAEVEETTQVVQPAPEPAPEPLPGPVPGSQEDLIVQVGDRVFFAYDSSELSFEAQSTIQALSVWMNDNPSVTLTLEGHCDERGTREYNLALGERRANAVGDYLVALGINPGRVSTISYGKERPAVPGSNESAWAQNRRGVFSVN